MLYRYTNRNTCLIACFASVLGSGGLHFLEAAETPGADAFQVVARVNDAEDRRESGVGTMISMRRYTLRNQRWEKDAVMDVRITSSPNATKRFEILAMENASGLQKKVFLKLLEAEVEASGNASQEAETRVNSDNYHFTALGTESINGRPCAVLGLKPKRNSKYLIAGKAWVDVQESAIVRVEGETARSVSFWIGKPQVTQSFRKVEGVWVSSANRSVSNVRLLGKTELTVDFLDYDIAQKDGRVVARNNAAVPGL